MARTLLIMVLVLSVVVATTTARPYYAVAFDRGVGMFGLSRRANEDGAQGNEAKDSQAGVAAISEQQASSK
eukprot:UN10294